MTPEQEAEVLRLRSAKVGTKQIARKLKLRPAEVTAVIQANATALLLPLHECLINHAASQQLLEPRADGLLEKITGKGEDDAQRGLAQVVISRQDGKRYLVGSYLVDYWCLGVKDVVSPRTMSRREYEMFKEHGRLTFEEAFDSITLAQAQAVVFGAVDYAQSFGLAPNSSFSDRAQKHLGGRPENLIPIEFGKDGKPYFICGPNDNPEKIIATLQTQAGEGNFHYIVPISDPGLELLEDF